MKNCIYYFTGTGNSLFIAKRLAEKLGNTEIKRITKSSIYQMKAETYDTVGIVYPVYWGSVPKIVLTFVKQLKYHQANYFYGVVTCGGMSAGASGQLFRAFKKNDMTLNASFEVVMPSNNQTSYPPASHSGIQSSLSKNERDIESIYSTILEKTNHALRFGVSSALGHVLIQVMIPKNSDKHFTVDESCSSCGLCSQVCPAGNIKLENGVPQYMHECYRCTACLQMCPKKSIQFKEKSRNWGRYHHPEVQVNELIVTH